MVHVCIVPTCKNSSRQAKKFHQIPSNRERFRLWINALGLQDYAEHLSAVKHNARVCTDHFDESSYVTVKKLKDDAVPQMGTKKANTETETCETETAQPADASTRRTEEHFAVATRNNSVICTEAKQTLITLMENTPPKQQGSNEDEPSTSSQAPSAGSAGLVDVGSAPSQQPTFVLSMLPTGQPALNVQQAVWISVPTGGTVETHSSSGYQISSAEKTNSETSSEKKRKLEGGPSNKDSQTTAVLQEDRVDAMARLWASRFRNLSPEQQKFAEQIIDAVLTEAEMGLLTLDDVTAAATASVAGDARKGPAQGNNYSEAAPETLDITYSESGPTNVDVEFCEIVPKMEPMDEHSETAPETESVDIHSGNILHRALESGSDPGVDPSLLMDTDVEFSDSVVKLEPVDETPEFVVPDTLVSGNGGPREGNAVTTANYLEPSKGSRSEIVIIRKHLPKGRTEGSKSKGLQSTTPGSSTSMVMDIKAEEEDFG